MSALMETYRRLPVAFEKGQGIWLWDTQGKRYLDALSGIAVCGLGHAHPAVTGALCKQAKTLVHTSNLYEIPLQEALATKLCEISGLDNVFFCNSGAEANEAAIKLARLFGHQKGVNEPAILVLENSFHGRTLAALSATGNTNAHSGFEPLVPGFIRVPINDPLALENAVQKHPNIVAVLAEPILGEGGILPLTKDYLQALKHYSESQDWLLMFDEVQCGVGRSGHWFAFQAAGIIPDVLTLAKGLGNGVPIGACLAGPKASQLFQPGHHGSTFGGNPLAASAALAVINTIENDNLLAKVQKTSEYLRQALESKLSDNPKIRRISLLGLMIGIEYDSPCTELVAKALEAGLLLNVTQGQVIRLLPPLIIEEAECQQLVNTLVALIEGL